MGIDATTFSGVRFFVTFAGRNSAFAVSVFVIFVIFVIFVLFVDLDQERPPCSPRRWTSQ